MNTDEMVIRQALITLHANIDRQGPGDDDFTKTVLNKLPEFPENLRIADLGCGTGAASLLLAERYHQPILCVDTSQEFLLSLDANAQGLGMETLINTLAVDMGSLDPQTHQFDLLWSEGAAYNLTFEGAMVNWRPLMAKDGVAVVSEMSWFGADRPQKAAAFWDEAYPQMASEEDNQMTAERHGFEVLFTARLPASAWWKNYYDPLLARAETLEPDASKTLQDIIAETRQEAGIFREFSDYMGYTFYALKAV